MNIKQLNKIIESYIDWGKPWGFSEFVITHKDIDAEQTKYFNNVMDIALEFDNWNCSDLVLGCMITQARLRKETELSDTAIANIVRSASYSWR
jgi:hypothetical protein